MMINPLSNDRIPKPTKRRYTTIKIPFPMINVEDELCSLLLVVFIDGRKTKCGIIAIKAIEVSNLLMIH